MSEMKMHKKILYTGEVKVNQLLPYSQERHLSLQRKWVKYDISIRTIFHVKRIQIEADQPVSGKLLFELLSNFLKYECLFDGRFFESTQILLDDEDVTVELEREMLSFYCGINSYAQLQQPDDVKTYKTGFCAWEHLSKTLNYPDQMYYTMAFSNGITPDLRLAIFAEALDAAALKMKTDRPVGIMSVKDEGTPKERLIELISEYGDDIFRGDDVEAFAEGMENMKQKMLHIQPFKRGALTIEEAEYYMVKLAELYRVILLGRSGMFTKEAKFAIQEEIRQLNEKANVRGV